MSIFILLFCFFLWFLTYNKQFQENGIQNVLAVLLVNLLNPTSTKSDIYLTDVDVGDVSVIPVATDMLTLLKRVKAGHCFVM